MKAQHVSTQKVDPNGGNRVWRWRKFSLLVQLRAMLTTISLFSLIVIISVVLLTQGKTPIPLSQLVTALFMPDQAGFIAEIIWNIRLPRVLTAVFAGAALGISGAIFQSISRNPLGSPDVIGFTTGAASGAIAWLVFIGPNITGVLIATLAGGLLTALAVYWLTLRQGQIDSYRLVLIGIGVGSTLSALNGLMLVKGNLDNAMLANLWLAGSLNARNWAHALPVMMGILLLSPFIVAFARSLSMTEMGDDLAKQLGVSVESSRKFMTLLGVLLAALATGAVGPIAFIALAAPQLAKRLGRQHQVSVVGSAAMGACLLLCADLVTQQLPGQLVLPIGRMTAIIGGLYLLWLLTRPRR